MREERSVSPFFPTLSTDLTTIWLMLSLSFVPHIHVSRIECCAIVYVYFCFTVIALTATLWLSTKAVTNSTNCQSLQRPTQDHLFQWPERVAPCYLCWDMYNPALLILRVMLNGIVDKHVTGASIATGSHVETKGIGVVSIAINTFSSPFSQRAVK